MNFNWNNVKPACCAKWLVLPTVYSDTLSYGEQLDKFCYQLNQLIENNNILPDFISEMIKEYINSGAIGEVVRDILADYILNVKYPPEGITPAVGDGSADDTAAIQGCIDYAAENGGVVYFPYGSYLTQPLTMKDGVSLFGFDRYSTKIVLKGGATKPLIGGTVADLSIANLTLDGNSGIQVNDVNVVTIMGTNVLFTNLIIKDGYTLVNYVGTGGHFQISDVVFGNAVEKCLLTAGNADVQCENVVFNQLSAVGGISVMDIGTDGGFFNVKSVATCNKCIVVSGNKNKISAIVENASIPVVDNGLHNNIEVFGVSNKEFYSGNTEKEVAGNYSKHIGGTCTNAVDGNSTESVDGDYSKVVTGVTTETYNGDKTVNGVNETKILSGKRTVSSNGYEETVTGNKNVSVGSLEENVSENKVTTSKNLGETVTLKKTVNAGILEENVGGIKTVNSESLQETVAGSKVVNCDTYNITTKNKTDKITGDYFIDTEKPIKYGEVTQFNEALGTVKWRDKNGNPYNVLTSDDPSKIISAATSLIDVRDFGAKGDGVTDDTKAIQDAIDWCVEQQKGFSVIITGGTYLISKTIDLWYDYNTSLIIQGAILKANAEMDFMVSCGYRKTEHWEGYYPYGVFGQGVIDCNNLAGGIVSNPGRGRIRIEDIDIRNCETVGISIGLPTDTMTHSAQAKIINVGVYGNSETNNGIGIADYHGDCYISHVIVMYMRVGMKLRAADFVDNVHIWGGKGFFGKPYEQEIIGISAGTSLYLSNAYIDTIPVGVYLNDNCECQASNIMFMNGFDFVTTCFNANYNCSINVDQLNIVDLTGNRVFNPLFLRTRPAANYFIGLKRFRATFTEKLTINYNAIVFNEFNNLVVNPYVTSLAKNSGPISAGYTLIGYINAMRSRLNFKLEVAPQAYFDFDIYVTPGGSVTQLRNESVKYSGGSDIEIVIGKKISNDYGEYLPVYIHASVKPSVTNNLVSVIVNGTQNAGFYPIVEASIEGADVVQSVEPVLTISVPSD